MGNVKISGRMVMSVGEQITEFNSIYFFERLVAGNNPFC